MNRILEILHIKYISASLFMMVAAAIVSPTKSEALSLEKVSSQKAQNEKGTNGFFPSEDVWFQDDAAATIFSKEPQKTESPVVGFYEERKLNEDFSHETELAKLNPELNNQLKNFDPKNATPEQIVKMFGDPTKEAKMTPIENAPVPFKGLMASLDSGNEELAFEYAKQYVRHIKNLQQRSKAVTDFTKIAMESEGLSPNEDNTTGNSNFVNSSIVKDQAVYKSLSPEAKRLISKAKTEDISNQEDIEHNVDMEKRLRGRGADE